VSIISLERFGEGLGHLISFYFGDRTGVKLGTRPMDWAKEIVS